MALWLTGNTSPWRQVASSSWRTAFWQIFAVVQVRFPYWFHRYIKAKKKLKIKKVITFILEGPLLSKFFRFLSKLNDIWQLCSVLGTPCPPICQYGKLLWIEELGCKGSVQYSAPCIRFFCPDIENPPWFQPRSWAESKRLLVINYLLKCLNNMKNISQEPEKKRKKKASKPLKED